MSSARLLAIGLAVVVALTAAVAGARDASSARSERCAQGSATAVIAGKQVCLRRGQRCSKRLDRQYHRYRFHCHSSRLTGGPKVEKPLPSAGRIVATVPVTASGGVAIGAGSVWVASTIPHTVTRIDPATNIAVARITIGDPTVDLFHGPTRMAFGHGTLWVLDGSWDCSCVHRIDPSTNRIADTITLGQPVNGRIAPLGIVVQPDAVWIALREGTEDSLDGSLVRVDPLTNRVAATVGAGANPAFGGPTRITAGFGSVWATVPSLKAVVRVDSATNSIAATIPGLTCGEGDLAADESAVWVADCDAVRRIDPATNAIAKTVSIPGATGAGVRGIAVGLGSVWAQAGPLVRIDPVSGRLLGSTPLDPSLVWGEYSVAVGFGSIWVRQIDSVVRIRPPG